MTIYVCVSLWSVLSTHQLKYQPRVKSEITGPKPIPKQFFPLVDVITIPVKIPTKGKIGNNLSKTNFETI